MSTCKERVLKYLQGTSIQKVYDELGLHTLIERKWHSKLTFFHEIVNGLLPGYLNK